MDRHSAGFRIIPGDTPEHLDTVRCLFRVYAAELGINFCFQGFEEELIALPGKYAPPAGAVLLGQVAGTTVGCVALRPLESGICEMKRLYVDPAHRKTGLGRALAVEIMRVGRAAGYRTMRLDTLATLTPALRLYESLGFRRIPPYYQNPLADVVYLECDLGSSEAQP